LAASALAASPARAALDCQTLPDLFRAYFLHHVTTRSLTDDLKKKTVEQYIKILDGSKTMLLERDVEMIRPQLMGLFETMPKGNCTALMDSQKLLVERAAENEAYVKTYVDDKYKLDETVEFVFDADKRAFPKTKEEREDLLRKFIHFQISNYLLADTKLPEAKKQLIHRYELVTKRLKERTTDDVYTNFTDAFAYALDPHSSYFSKDRLEDFQIDMGLSLEGIGAQLSSQDGYTVVEEIIPGGAADRAKVLKPKDKIIAVGQEGKKPESVIDMELRDVVKRIRGKKGSKVFLTIMRQDGNATSRVEVSIVRDKIDLKESAAKIRFETVPVGKDKLKLAVLELPSFYGDSKQGKVSSFKDMRRLLLQAKKEKADGILFNLARNGGGLLDEAVRISGLFIKKGNVVGTRNSRGDVEMLSDDDEEITWNGPVVVLTSRLSASASEILAGALRDYKRALIVGADHTFGKGTVQAVIPLARDLGAIKVTTQMFFIPGGNSTQHNGVPGDIQIPTALSEEIGEKALENSLPAQKIPAFLSADANSVDAAQSWKSVDPAFLEAFRNRSSQRVAADSKLQEILKDAEEAKKNEGLIKLTDVRKKAGENKKKQKAEEKKSLADRIKDAEAPYVGEGLKILADLVVAQRSGVGALPALPAAKMPKAAAATKPAAGSKP
jgi:carboxyl-terminal processing protease